MRLQIFSDLHGDVAPVCPIVIAPGVDAVIVTGDTCEGADEAFARLRQIVPMQVPIVMTMGNHEYYRRHLAGELASARQLAPVFGIHLLENDAIVLGGVRFVGATLWTDYGLFGPANVPLAMRAANVGLRDHKRIAWSKQPWQRFRPAEALRLHSQSRRFIADALKTPHASPTVVITHHAPHPGSLHPRYSNDILSGAYVSDLSSLIETGAPDLWVHGHVHSSFDYKLGRTRIVCNPHGYGRENPAFDPAMVVEVGA
jgi:Icc-related predicted phosphoesterase